MYRRGHGIRSFLDDQGLMLVCLIACVLSQICGLFHQGTGPSGERWLVVGWKRDELPAWRMSKEKLTTRITLKPHHECLRRCSKYSCSCSGPLPCGQPLDETSLTYFIIILRRLRSTNIAVEPQSRLYASMAMTMRKAVLALCVSLVCALQVSAQTAASPTFSTAPKTNSTTRTPTLTSSSATSSAPDVYLNVPTLSVGRIELVVDDLSALVLTHSSNDRAK